MFAVVKKVKAQKDYPQFGVKQGQEHYTWSIPSGGTFIKYRSVSEPKKSQLVPPGYQQDLAVLKESAEALVGLTDSWDIDALIVEILDLQQSTEDKLRNMPDQLQSGDTGQLLQERIDELEAWITELRDIMDDANEIVDGSEDAPEQWDSISERIQSATP